MRKLLVGFILGAAVSSAIAATLNPDLLVVNHTRVRFSRQVILNEGESISCSWPGFTLVSPSVPNNRIARLTLGLTGIVEQAPVP
jgi:hypothetical protein